MFSVGAPSEQNKSCRRLEAYLRMIDSHCHLDDYEDLGAILERASAAGVLALLAIGIGDGPSTMHRALEIARAHHGEPTIFASAGIHPQEAANATPKALARLRESVADPRCIAAGEIGLDYYHAENPDIAVQQAAFVAQMRIASEEGKPIVIHCRTAELADAKAKAKFGAADAWDDVLRLLGEHWPVEASGIMHCFSGTVEQARLSVEAGFYVSFAGNLTYLKSTVIREAAVWIPSERLLVETDAPFLAPVPHRGKRNEPALVAHTAAYLAALRGIRVDELAAQTTENFMRLFPSARGVIAAALL